MKTTVVIYEGAADVPLDDFGGRTPLQVARCPHAAQLAVQGAAGMLAPLPERMEDRFEILPALLMGMSEKQAVQVQRGPAEAASLAEDISAFKAAYCGSFVTMDDHWLRDCAVKHLALEETRSLARCLEAEWPAGDLVFRAVAPGRVCVLLRDAVEVPDPGVPPCSLEGDRVDAFFSGGRQTGLPADVFETSGHILAHQTLNDVRLDLGENPANALWIWGGGLLHRTQDLITAGRAGGLMLTQSPMAAGMARMTGMDILPLKAPWQCKKAGPAFPLKKVVDAVRRHDRIFIYVEAPAKLYQYGSARDKVRALEAVDQHLLGPMLSVLEAHGPFRVVLCSNGFVSTPENRCMALETPLVVSGTNLGRDESAAWNEEQCAGGSLGTMNVEQLMEALTEGI